MQKLQGCTKYNSVNNEGEWVGLLRNCHLGRCFLLFLSQFSLQPDGINYVNKTDDDGQFFLAMYRKWLTTLHMSIQYKSHIETLLGNGKSVVINKLPMSKHFTVLFDQYVKTVTMICTVEGSTA